MNANLLKRLYMLLAATNLSTKEIEALALQLKNVETHQFVNAVKFAKKLIEEFPENSPELEDAPLHLSATSNVPKKISSLLIDEARLPKTFAMELLAQEIKSRVPWIEIPRDSKKGFEAWINRLLFQVTESELLHIATVIRNKYVHTRPSDWRLK
ncbi:hypothetical protein [Acidovorax sp. ST3]|uniref:hypothetical protein n=1 Tax=Acidovorax sp. ST3 TaxID=2219062 RepID=UPI0012907D6C|nr:hypothetical protein [Acidovorax sp. ST3]